jgi:hypothetical protein
MVAEEQHPPWQDWLAEHRVEQVPVLVSQAWPEGQSVERVQPWLTVASPPPASALWRWTASAVESGPELVLPLPSVEATSEPQPSTGIARMTSMKRTARSSYSFTP